MEQLRGDDPTHVGGYRLRARLGAGGMGAVVANPPAAPCKNASLRTALRYGCTAVFAKLADDLGEKKLGAAAERLGFNDKKLDVPVRAAESVFPTSAGRPMNALNGIGMGKVRTTPLQLAMVLGAIANDGLLPRPHLVSRVTDPDGKVLFRPPDQAPRKALNPLVAKELRDALVTAVEQGTGKPAAVRDVEVAGKGGGAQQVGEGHERQLNWFAACADGGDRKVAVAVVREERKPDSGDLSSASESAATARAIIEAAVGPKD
ncbi:penicillin-binding transpeptidase domain-containing protein [Streptomyces boninensis]|uniref:penicillin-binding transpeptidase domain-containing protein n=1 Tax=Streptomyces boninensis TaxID=2039455 RepID=UPI003B226D42